MAKKRLEILTDVDRTAINKRIDDISTEYVFGFEETFVATANQVEFVLSKEFDKGMQAVELYINGVKQPSSFFTEVNNTTIKTKKPIAQGDIVNIKAYKSKKTIEIKTTTHKDSHISGDDQLPVATDSTKGLMAPEDKKKIKAVEIKANSALEKVAEHDTEIDNLKQSVSDGKKKVSVAITDKGVETAPDATFDVMATNISKIETDPSIGTTDAVAGDVLEGKTAVSQGEHITGTMTNNGTLSKTITTQGGIQKITPGYYEGGEVKAQFNNLISSNIKSGVNIGGVIGNLNSLTLVTKTTEGWGNKTVSYKFWDKVRYVLYCRGRVAIGRWESYEVMGFSAFDNHPNIKKIDDYTIEVHLPSMYDQNARYDVYVFRD